METENQWYRIRFFAGEVKAGEHRKLRNEMLRLYNQRGRPAGVALYSTRIQPNGGIQLFLSPAAYACFSRAIHMRRVRPTTKPPPSDVTVVLGDRVASISLLDD